MVQSPSAEWIFKILRLPEWQAFQSARRFAGSPDDLRDGFIHFSTASQVQGTLETYFAAEAGVALVRVAVAPLADAIRWEPSRNGALFPHLYRALILAEVADALTLRRGPEGYDISKVRILP